MASSLQDVGLTDEGDARDAAGHHRCAKQTPTPSPQTHPQSRFDANPIGARATTFRPKDQCVGDQREIASHPGADEDGQP